MPCRLNILRPYPPFNRAIRRNIRCCLREMALEDGDARAGERVLNDRRRIQGVALQRICLGRICLERRQQLRECLIRRAGSGGGGRTGTAGIGIRGSLSVVVVTVMSAPENLSQILKIGQLAGAGSRGKIGCELIQLGGGRGISARRRRLSGVLQVGSDLLRDLLILCGVRLLKLLERACKLSKGRELANIRQLRCGTG